VPPNGGYHRLENQLYRVEIHDETIGGTTYVWSRDNGSLVARLEGITTSTGGDYALAVSQVGRDSRQGFGSEQLVEITDRGRMLRSQPGVLVRIRIVEGRTLLLHPVGTTTLTMADFPVDPVVRRWEGSGTVQPGTWVELEDGVFIEFAEGPEPAAAFRTGDFWTIPARTLTGQVEWPRSGDEPLFEQRQGPWRHSAPLAIATIDSQGVWSDVRDCRTTFRPLTDRHYLHHVGGEGQEVVPPVPLGADNLVDARDLEVGVTNGGTPVAGVPVVFEVTEGAGKVGDSHEDQVTVVTDANGVATCPWQVDGATRTQRVEATLQDQFGQPPPQVVRFTAQLSAAPWVAYDGSHCTTLADGQTVDDAITTLTRITRLFPLAGSGEDVLRGGSVTVRVLVADQCGPVDGADVTFDHGARGSGEIEDVQGTTVDGVASCRWTPDPDTPTQDLRATLTAVPTSVDDRHQHHVLHQPQEVDFVANLSTAVATSYSPPDDCPEMKGVDSVQAALDKLLDLLPRLHHVSGDGLEAAVGETIQLQVGISNWCGVVRPQVQFEHLQPEGDWDRTHRVDLDLHRGEWSPFDNVEPDPEGIASCSYQVTEEPRQLLRARLLGRGEPIGQPVYFTVSPEQSQTDQVVPAARLGIWNGGQSAANITRTLVAFSDQAEFDTDGLFDAGEPTSLRATREGTYLAVGEIGWDKTSGNGYRSAEIMLGGNGVGQVGGPPLPSGVYTSQQVTAIVRLRDGERVQLGATQSSGGSLLIFSATLSLAWLGP
jgi:hypothetical protein